MKLILSIVVGWFLGTAFFAAATIYFMGDYTSMIFTGIIAMSFAFFPMFNAWENYFKNRIREGFGISFALLVFGFLVGFFI
jgi:hypothetical protein